MNASVDVQENVQPERMSPEQRDEFFALIAGLKSKGLPEHCEWLGFNFSGSGDDGQVQDIYLMGGDEFDTYRSWTAENPKELIGQELLDKIEEFLFEHFVTFDWHNNDGGGGDIGLHIATGRVVLDGYWNETTRHPETGEWVP